MKTNDRIEKIVELAGRISENIYKTAAAETIEAAKAIALEVVALSKKVRRHETLDNIPENYRDAQLVAEAKRLAMKAIHRYQRTIENLGATAEEMAEAARLRRNAKAAESRADKAETEATTYMLAYKAKNSVKNIEMYAMYRERLIGILKEGLCKGESDTIVQMTAFRLIDSAPEEPKVERLPLEIPAEIAETPDKDIFTTEGLSTDERVEETEAPSEEQTNEEFEEMVKEATIESMERKGHCGPCQWKLIHALAARNGRDGVQDLSREALEAKALMQSMKVKLLFHKKETEPVAVAIPMAATEKTPAIFQKPEDLWLSKFSEEEQKALINTRDRVQARFIGARAKERFAEELRELGETKRMEAELREAAELHDEAAAFIDATLCRLELKGREAIEVETFLCPDWNEKEADNG